MQAPWNAPMMGTSEEQGPIDFIMGQLPLSGDGHSGLHIMMGWESRKWFPSHSITVSSNSPSFGPCDALTHQYSHECRLCQSNIHPSVSFWLETGGILKGRQSLWFLPNAIPQPVPMRPPMICANCETLSLPCMAFITSPPM